MERIKNLFLLFCMIAGAFLLQGKNVNAEEFNPEIIGTLTNAGDSVKVEYASEDNKKYIKYVSSTDEVMYVYTDAKSENPKIEVFDRNGEYVTDFCEMGKVNGEYLDPAKTENYNNAEIFIKLKKGEVYYFATYLQDTLYMEEYNVNLIKTSKMPRIDVSAQLGGKSIKLSEVDLSKEGISYDMDKYVLTLENADIPYVFNEYSKDQNYNLFFDRLIEVKVLGKNTITSDYSYYFYTRFPTEFTGNGTLTFKTKTKDGSPNLIIEGGGQYSLIRIDGPTLETSVDLYWYFINAFKVIIDSGKLVYSGKSHEIISARYLYVNGGVIDSMDGMFSWVGLRTEYLEVNGGVIRLAIHCIAEENNGEYPEGFVGIERLRINDGTIVVKYFDQKVEYEHIYLSYIFSSSHEVSIKDGNIYVIVPNKVKGALGDKFAQIIWVNEDGPYPDVFISDKANIQKGSTIDISKVECSLEYDKCKYDGKEKKPAVTVNGLVEGTDYTVTYSNNVNPGTAKVTITGKGDFTGKKELSFIIEENNDTSKADAPKIGATIKDKKYIYKVTKAGSKDGAIGEVMVTGLKKKSLKKIKIATKVTIGGIKYKVTSIGVKAFKGNKKIIKLTIGKNVKTIGAYAFANCKKLKKVTINTKKLKKVGKKAFFRKGGKNISFKVPKSKKKVYKKLLKKAKTKKFVVK